MIKKSNSNIKSFIDPTSFSDPEAGLDLFAHSVRQSVQYDAFGDKTTFRARVLSIPIPMNSAAFRTSNPLGPPPAPGTEFLSKKVAYAFRARIIDDPSPHWMIPDPCDTTYIGADTEAQKLVMLHTKFIMSIADVSDVPAIGDIVAVKLKKDTFSYNLQVGEALHKVQPSKTEATIFGTACGGKCGGAPPTVAVLPGTGPARLEITPRGHVGPYGSETLENKNEWFDELPSLEQIAPEPPPVVNAMLNMGYYVSGHPDDPNWPNAATLEGHVMIVGVRRRKQHANRFVDRLQTIWYENGKWNVLSSYGTTVPGTGWLSGKRSTPIKSKDPITGKMVVTGRTHYNGKEGLGNPAAGGTFVMKPGQYWDSHAWGSHPPGYRTLVQRGDITGIREDDLSIYYGDDPTPTEHTDDNFGVNIHNSGNSTAKDKRIGPYSAGCQVFKIKDRWKQHVSAWENASATYGQKKFTYTLLLEEEILPDAQGLSGMQSVDFDAFVRWGWDRQAALTYLQAEFGGMDIGGGVPDLPTDNTALPESSKKMPGYLGASAQAPLYQEPEELYRE